MFSCSKNNYLNLLKNFPPAGQRHNYLLRPINAGLAAGAAPDMIMTDLLKLAPDMEADIQSSIEKAMSAPMRPFRGARHSRPARAKAQRPSPEDIEKAWANIRAQFPGMNENSLECLLDSISKSGPGVNIAYQAKTLLRALYSPSDIVYAGYKCGRDVFSVESLLASDQFGWTPPPQGVRRTCPSAARILCISRWRSPRMARSDDPHFL